VEIPDPQYLETDDGAYIAYQAVGEGPIDIAWQVEFGANLDVWWELLAAGDPARVQALAWWNPLPRTAWAPDYPWSEGPDDLARRMRDLNGWGTLSYGESWADDLEQLSGGHRPSQEAIRCGRS
jgi:hypothetical protein